MQNRALYLYAVAGSMMKEKADYIDCFWPFVVCSMSSDVQATVASIQEAVERKYASGLPQHVVSVLLRRAEKKGYVRYDAAKRTYALTPKGADYARDMSAETDAIRRVNALINSMCEFFAAHQVTIQNDAAETLLFRFAQKNLNLMLPYLIPGSSPTIGEAGDNLQAEERLLLSYVQEVNRADPQKYAALQDVIIGAVLTVLLTKPDVSEIQEYQKRKIRDCTIYLDTNLVISMLGLDPKERSAAASELLSMMRAASLRLRVFDFTVDELCSLIGAYQGNFYKYTNQIKVDDLYSELKRKGWGPEDARSYIMHIDEHLRAIGVEVEDVPAVDLDTYVPQHADRVDLIAQYKPRQYRKNSVNHDLAAIDQIVLKRKGSRRMIEKCGAVFVTSDGGLARFNFECYDHRGTATVPEVIPDRALATMLWLKNPTGSPPMKLILATYSRELGVNHRIWNRFLEIMLGLLRKNWITDDDVSAIIYDPMIEETLSELGLGSEQTIDDAYVLEQAEAVRNRQLQTRDTQLQAQSDEARARERQVVQELTSANKEALQKYARDWEEHAEKQRKAERASAARISIWLSTIICMGCTVVIGWILVPLPSRLQDFVKLVACYILEGGGPFWLVWWLLRPFLQRTFARRIYTRNIAKLDLQETGCVLDSKLESKDRDADQNGH